MSCARFNYENIESSQKGGIRTIRKVSIKNGKGYKSVTKYNRDKYVGTSKKLLEGGQVVMIKNRKFIPGLFNDCVITGKCSRKGSKK
jgi:hypothetical protein